MQVSAKLEAFCADMDLKTLMELLQFFWATSVTFEPVSRRNTGSVRLEEVGQFE